MSDPARNRGNAAIYYLPNEFTRERGKLMGRQSAGEAFVKALGRHAVVDRFHAYAPNREAAEAFAKHIASGGGQNGGKAVNWIPLNQISRLSEAGCMLTYDPGLPKWTWQRQFVGAAAYSVCGISHTTASHNVMDAFGSLPLAPVQPWDALICTSECVRQTVDNILENWSAYLAERLGASKQPRPMLPVIPLGVDCDSFADSPAKQSRRADFRKKHNIADGDVVVLFLGRLSFHAKAHPYPMYLALEQAARKTGQKIHLIQTGWFGNQGIERAFREGARDFAPSINAIFGDGRSADDRAGSWAAADIFCSLSDNIQETFGLTPIEAMANGIPQVISDWDGYRDTVRDGIDGFAVPTLTPPDGSGEVLARQHAIDAMNYDNYVGIACHSIAVDIKKTTEAFIALIENPDLRRKMGEAGRQRARDVFDWSHIIASYQNLWHEMAERRRRDGAAVAANPALRGHPSRPDPFTLFNSYPSERFDDDFLLSAGTMEVLPDFEQLRQHGLTRLANSYLDNEESSRQILDRVNGASSIRVGDLVDGADDDVARHRLYRTIGWMLKTGLVEKADAG